PRVVRGHVDGARARVDHRVVHIKATDHGAVQLPVRAVGIALQAKHSLTSADEEEDGRHGKAPNAESTNYLPPDTGVKGHGSNLHCRRRFALCTCYTFPPSGRVTPFPRTV